MKTKIKTSPDSICNLLTLEKIRLLRCTELESLPGKIGNLQSLVTLFIRGGKLKSLPESIGNISSLQSLQLQYTIIENLPDSIGNLINLDNLGITSAQIEHGLDVIDYPDYYRDEETEKRSPFSSLPDAISKL